MEPFVVIRPEADPLPIVCGIPHCGTRMPDEVSAPHPELHVDSREEAEPRRALALAVIAIPLGPHDLVRVLGPGVQAPLQLLGRGRQDEDAD